LHPARNGGICTGFDQNARYLKRTVSCNLSKRCVADHCFIMRINVSTILKKQPHHTQVRPLRGVMEWRLAKTIKAVWIHAGREQGRHPVYVSVHGGEVKIVVFDGFEWRHGFFPTA